MKGLFIDNDYFDFDEYTILEPNSVCKIEIGDKSILTLFEEIKLIKLKTSDILEHEYNVNCDFEYTGSSHFIEIESENKKIFSTETKYIKINNLSIPELVVKDRKKS